MSIGSSCTTSNKCEADCISALTVASATSNGRLEQQIEARHLLLFGSELVTNISDVTFEYEYFKFGMCRLRRLHRYKLVPTAYTSVYCAIYQPHTQTFCFLFFVLHVGVIEPL
jgi:hypothetical protein